MACTSRASRRRTCSRRCSSGAGSWRTSSSRRATSSTTAASVVATATTGRPRCSSRSSARATSSRSTSCSAPTPSCCRRCSTGRAAGTRRSPADSDFVYKQTIKAKACDALRGILPAATLSNVGIYGTGQGYEALLLRMRAHPLPEARRYADMMLTELRKVVPSFLTRVDRPERGGAWSQYLQDTRDHTADVVHRVFGRETAEPRPGRDARRLRPRGRGQGARGGLLPAHEPARGPAARQGAHARRRRARRAAARVRGGAGQPSPQAGPRVRTHRLPLRRARRLRRVPRPATPPHAHDRVAAAVTRARLRRAGAGRRGRASPTQYDEGDGRLGRALRRDGVPIPGAGVVRGVARVPAALRDADERARGDAPHRAADHAAGPPVVPRRRPGDAPPHRRARRPPRASRRR